MSRAADAAAFGAPVSFVLDGTAVAAPAGASVLNAAHHAGVYIPALCAHPDLPPALRRGGGGEGCQLCLVEVDGRDGLHRSCDLAVAPGLSIRTATPAVIAARQTKLAKILAHHPHVCLTCPQREGCSRSQCSYGNPPATRCCEIFASCELRKIADHIGIPNNTPVYRPDDLTVSRSEPFFDRDYNLCIDCRRCLTACNDVREVGCLEVKAIETADGTRHYVGAIAETLVESGCRFCQACVTVCPTGALIDRTLDPAHRESSRVPCEAACPAGIDVPRYVQLASEGRYGEAVAVVREKLPFPGILGRACFAMCEGVCRRGELDEPIAIRSLKRLAADNDDGRWRAHAKRLPPSGRRAAVIGAGPAGLTVAYYLAKQGHAVAVFDAHPAGGGMARYGIPSYRVPIEVIANEVGEVARLGVEFRYDTRVEDVAALFAAGYEAIFIGIGCQAGDALGVPGDDLPGVVDSPTFLRAATMGLVNTEGGIMTGRKVAVIGGGNVATDNARSSRRLGAEVDMVYRRTQAEMPAREDELAGCLDEGVNVHYLLAPIRIEPHDGEARLAITYQEMRLGEPDASGRARPVPVPGTERTHAVDLVIAAVGQRPHRAAHFGVDVDASGRFVVRADTLMTSRAGVYAGGDCVLGSATLIEAVAHGRIAAAAIDLALGGDGDISEVLLPPDEPMQSLGREDGFNRRPRVKPPLREPAARAGWDEVECAYADAEGRREAARCLRCNLAAGICAAPLPPTTSLRFDAATIAGVPAEAGVFQLIDATGMVTVIKGVENLRAGLAGQLAAGVEAGSFVFEEAALYTSRESQLIQAYVQTHGRMPGGGADDLDDLF
ncbi:MAG: FAD-dependent oxidoreductase [Gammaproteobacteria bacterium]|nr:FAD-dependent oxidoreductase [Gammaproteobacteria bacterium]